MPRRDQEVTLRLSVEEKAVIRKALQEIGEDGERMAKAIDRSTRNANRALKTLDGAANEAKDSIGDLADRAGPLGRVVKSLGPAGLAAAAGIGALVVGLTAAVRIGKEAVSQFAEIGKQADVMGITVETFQALRAESDAQGISFSILETGMKALEERQSQIIQGQGELFTRLKDTNPELLRQLEALDSNEDRLRAVSTALAQAESQTDRNRIAYAAFGEAGAQVSKVLLSTGGDIDALVGKGRELGLVMDQELIRRSQELQVEMEIAGQVMDLQFKQAFVDFAPVALDTIRFLGDIAKGLSDISNGMRDVQDRSSRFNRERLQELQGVLFQGGVSSTAVDRVRAGGAPLGEEDLPERFSTSSRRRLRRLMQEFNEIVSLETERAAVEFVQRTRRELAGLTSEQLTGELERTRTGIDERRAGTANFGISRLNEDELPQFEQRAEVIESLIEEAKAREAGAKATREQLAETQRLKDAEAEAERQRRERLTLMRQAATLLTELGDATLALQIKEQELAKLRDAELITQAQYDQALESYRDKVTGVTAATQRWQKVIEGADTEVETIQQSIKALNDDLASGALGDAAEATALYTEALEALSEALDKAKQAEKEATPEFKAGAEIREKLAQARKAAMTDQELLAAEEQRLDALVASGNLTRDEATEYMRAYSEELRKARGQVSLLERAESLLEGVMSGRIKTVGDLGKAIAALVVDMIRQAAIAQAQIGNNQSFGGFLQGIVGSVLGGFGGGVNPSGTPPIVPQSHSGSRAPHFPARRSSAQRLMSDEHMVVVQNGQEIVTGNDRDQIIDYIRQASNERAQPNALMRAGPMPLDINLNIHQTGGGGDADVSASQSGDNEFDIDVFFRDRVRGAAADGALDDALTGRGFVQQVQR